MFYALKMKRNPSRLLEKEKPRERLDPFRARPVSYVLMNNTTDMQSVSRTRHKSAQISAISQNATGQCAQAAARGPRPAGASRRLEAGPLGTNAKLRATFENPMARRVERFALQSVARDILPDSRTAKCLRIRAHDKDVQVWKSKNHKTASYGGLQTCGASGRVLSVGLRWSRGAGERYSKQWLCIAPVAARCIFDPHGSPYPL